MCYIFIFFSDNGKPILTGEVVSTSKLILLAAFSFLGEGAFLAEDGADVCTCFSSVMLPLLLRLGLLGAGDEERGRLRSEAAGLTPLALFRLLLLTHRLRESKAVKVRGEDWLARTFDAELVDRRGIPAELILFGVHGADLMEGDDIDDEEEGDNDADDNNLTEDDADADVKAKGKEPAPTEVVQELVMVCEFSLSQWW